MRSNGVFIVRVDFIFIYNVTSLVRSYVHYCFSRSSFRAIVSALWCLLVLFHSRSYLSWYSIM